MLKLLALQNASRRSNSFRGTTVLDGGADSNAMKSPAAMFWITTHWICCIISLVLGFRFSRLLLFLLLSSNPSPISTTRSSIASLGSFGGALSIHRASTHATDSTSSTTGAANKTLFGSSGAVSGSRVVVGRHGIRIRPWPHPNPEEVMRAHRILERVQMEQKAQYGVKNPRAVIVVTPTYVRTFQTLHLTGVMHSLMNCPYKVIWIVVEAGGPTDETASLIGKSGIQTIHVGFNQRMPLTWDERHKMECRMRLAALREVRERKLDGIVMFADDSNMHSMEIFDELQKLKWIGAASVGILLHSGGANDPLPLVEDEQKSLPVQGPSCNSSGALVGWHTFNSLPYEERRAVYIGDVGAVLPSNMEWAGFVLNSRLLWKDGVDDKPAWIKDLDSLSEEDVESPLSLVVDRSVVEPLGSCGRNVMLWWLRVEARSDSKFPSRWVIDPPLDVTIRAKHTPWPDLPPEIPADLKVPTVAYTEERTEKRPPKTRSSKSRRSKGRKRRERRVTDAQNTLRQSGGN